MANDIAIILGIIVFLGGLGALLPFIQEDFGRTQVNPSQSAITDDIAEHADGGTTSIWRVIASIGKMFFWTFGDIPIIIDAIIMVPIRIILYLIIARNIWIGGGG